MLDFDFDKMLFTIGPEDHSADRIKTILNEHPEVQFVSLVGIDIGGHGTDEKIPLSMCRRASDFLWEASEYRHICATTIHLK